MNCDPIFDETWEPLIQAVGAELCGEFMFMASYPKRSGGFIHAYKHRQTRRYLNIDDDGNFWKSNYAPNRIVTHEEAFEHVYGNCGQN